MLNKLSKKYLHESDGGLTRDAEGFDDDADDDDDDVDGLPANADWDG